MPSLQLPPADPDDAPGAGYLAKYGPSSTDDIIYVSKSGVIHHGPSLQGVANAISRDASEMRAARQAALVRSAACPTGEEQDAETREHLARVARLPTLARDVTLARVLLAGRRAGVQPSAGATDAGGVKAEMELMDAGI